MKYQVVFTVVALLNVGSVYGGNKLDGTSEGFWQEHAVIFANVTDVHWAIAGNSNPSAKVDVLATIAGTLDATLVTTNLPMESSLETLEGLEIGDQVIALVTRVEDGNSLEEGTLYVPPSPVPFFPSGCAIEIVDGIDDLRAKAIIANLRKLREPEAAKADQKLPPWLEPTINIPKGSSKQAHSVADKISGFVEDNPDGRMQLHLSMRSRNKWLPEGGNSEFEAPIADGDYVAVLGRVFRATRANGITLSVVDPSNLPPGVTVGHHSIISPYQGLFDSRLCFSEMKPTPQGTAAAHIAWGPKITYSDGPPSHIQIYSPVGQDVAVGDLFRIHQKQNGQPLAYRVIKIVLPDEAKHIAGWVEFDPRRTALPANE